MALLLIKTHPKLQYSVLNSIAFWGSNVKKEIGTSLTGLSTSTAKKDTFTGVWKILCLYGSKSFAYFKSKKGHTDWGLEDTMVLG